MGLGHWLANIGKAAGYIAAPFTGGLSLLAEPAIGAIEGAQNGGGWTGALKGGAIGGAEAAIPFGVGKVLGPALGGVIGNMGSKIATPIIGNMANGAVHGLEQKVGLTKGNAPAQSGGKVMANLMDPMANYAGGYDDAGNPTSAGYDESGNVTNDPSQVYQDWNGNVVSSSPDTGYVGYDVNGNPTNDPKGAYQDMDGNIIGSDGSPVGGQGTGIIQKLLATLKGNNPSGLADATKTLGGIADAEALNRYKKNEMSRAYDTSAMQAERLRNENETDAMKKLHQTGYILGGGSKYGQPVHLNSGTMPIFPNGPMKPTAAMQSGAQSLQDQLGARLKPGGSYTPTPPELDRGKLEQVGQWGGVATGIGGAISDLLGGGQPQGNNNPQAPYGGIINNLMTGWGQKQQGPSLSNSNGLPPGMMT